MNENVSNDPFLKWVISFITLNGKEGFGEVVNKMPIVNKSLPQKWRILNVKQK